MTALIEPCPDCGEPRTQFGPHIIHAADIFTAENIDGEPRSRTICPAMAEVQRILAEANTPIQDGLPVTLPASARPLTFQTPDPDWHKVPTLAGAGRFGVELALPAPAEEVQRTIKLGIDLAADRAVVVACEIRDGVTYLLATHELDPADTPDATGPVHDPDALIASGGWMKPGDPHYYDLNWASSQSAEMRER